MAQTSFLNIFLLLIYALVPFGLEKHIHGAWITSTDIFIVIAIVRWLIKERSSLKHNAFPLLPLIALLFLTFILSAFNALDKMLFVKEFIKYIFIFGLFYVSVNNTDNKSVLKYLPLIILISSLAQSLWYIHDFISAGRVMFTNKMWIRSFLNSQHLNLVGTFLCLTMPFGLFFVFSNRPMKYRIGALVAVFVQVAALILTYSRGNWIAAVITLSMILAYRYKKGIRGVILFLGLMVLPFIAAIYFFPGLHLQEKFMSTFNPKDGSTLDRMDHINAALTLIKQHPLLGIGMGNFQLTSANKLHITVLGIVHNMFLQSAVEAGIPSMILMILLIGTYFRDSYRIIKGLNNDNNYKWLLICGTASFTGLIISSQFGDPFIRYLKEYFALLLSLPYAVQRLVRRDTL